VKTLYDEARARPATDRAGFLAGACLGDMELQRDVQTLLDQPLSTDDFVGLVGGPSSTLVAQAIAEHHVPLTGRRIGTFEIKALRSATYNGGRSWRNVACSWRWMSTKESIDVSLAEEGRDGEVRLRGTLIGIA
jgi:hypothetical protein